ncbi:MAG: TolC family protein [Paludibacteraceae bacterium]|nr:TolC family protein [Paludibacteraceae bacterium]
MKKLLFCIFFSVLALQGIAQNTLYTLEDCRTMAMSKNKDIQIAQEKIQVATSMKKATFTQYLPSFSANGGYMWNEKDISLMSEDAYLPVYVNNTDGTKNYPASWNNSWTMVNGNALPLDANGVPFDPTKNPEKISWKSTAYLPKEAFEADIRNVFAGSIMMTQPLFLGGKIRELNNIANSAKKISEFQLDGKISEILLETDAAYWRVISLVNKEKLANSYVAMLQKLSGDLEKSILFGVATKSEGLAVKVKLNEADMQLLQVQNGLSLSRMLLCQLCGLPLGSDFHLADEDVVHEDALFADKDVNVEEAMKDRYEINSLEEMINIAESNRKIMLSRFMPNAVLTAGYLLSNPNVYNGFSADFSGMWQVGVVLNVPLFHFGERIHTLNAARSEKKIVEYKLDDAKEKIRLDIAQASFKLSEASKRLTMTHTNKDKSEENLRYANVGFEAGVVAPSVLIEAQTAWLKANSEDVDAAIDAKICDVYLQKALGYLK